VAERTFVKLQNMVAWKVFGFADVTSANMSTQFRTQIKDALNEALTMVCVEIQQRSTRRNGTITLSSASTTSLYSLPARCMRFIQETAYYEDRKSVPLGWTTEQEWTVQGGQENASLTGPPELLIDFGYDTTLKKYQVKVLPFAGAAENGFKIYFQYDEAPAEMSADADVPPLPDFLHDGLVHGAIVLGFASMMDPIDLNVESAAWMAYKRILNRSKEFSTGKRALIRSGYVTPRRHWGRNFGTLS
jgi:hypothetical protein